MFAAIHCKLRLHVRMKHFHPTGFGFLFSIPINKIQEVTKFISIKKQINCSLSISDFVHKQGKSGTGD